MISGGDVKISNMKLYVSIDTQIKATDRQVLWNYSSMLGIRDITLPRNSPVTKSIQYYPVTDIILLSNHRSGTEGNRNDSSSHTDHINHSNNKSSDTHQQHHHRRVSDKYSEVINDILNNIDKGFNACLLTMGMSNSGKTYHLFGDLGCYDCIQSINVDHDQSLYSTTSIQLNLMNMNILLLNIIIMIMVMMIDTIVIDMIMCVEYTVHL